MPGLISELKSEVRYKEGGQDPTVILPSQHSIALSMLEPWCCSLAISCKRDERHRKSWTIPAMSSGDVLRRVVNRNPEVMQFNETIGELRCELYNCYTYMSNLSIVYYRNRSRLRHTYHLLQPRGHPFAYTFNPQDLLLSSAVIASVPTGEITRLFCFPHYLKHKTIKVPLAHVKIPRITFSFTKMQVRRL